MEPGKNRNDFPEGPDTLLVATGITKRFPGVVALLDVGISVEAGCVTAVVGENGAGKSTLMKILAGVEQCDAGSIVLDGQDSSPLSPRHATELGIALIHQELSLLPNLSVAANMFLGRERHAWLRRRHCAEASGELLRRVGLHVSPYELVGDLAIGQRQLVEIARALSTDARVLIMDEPTSSLSAPEADALFSVIRELRSRGVGILYVSHRLGEVEELADRVVVLRDGCNAGILNEEAICREEMIQRMVGREVAGFYSRMTRVPRALVLEVQNFVLPQWPGHAVSLHLRAGEIVGLAGLMVSGRTELLRALFGIDRALSGRLAIGGVAIDIRGPRDAIRSGLALVPEERAAQGLILGMNVRHNLSLAALGRHRYFGGWVDHDWEAGATAAMRSRLHIRGPEGVVAQLSGGNQQKVVLGKALLLSPRVLLMDEPTRGIDVGAKHEFYQLMEELAQRGIAILFASSEMEEILGMSDRVLVMHEGCLAGELLAEDLSEEAVMRLATGSA